MPRTEYTYRKGTKLVAEIDMTVVTKRLRFGKRTCIPGFGCFEVRKIRAKRFFNNQIGKVSHAPTHNKVKFTPSAVLKKSIQ